MYHRERRKMKYLIYVLLSIASPILSKTIERIETLTKDPLDENFDNNIIDFDEDYTLKLNNKYGQIPWHSSDKFNRESHKYTIIKETEEKTNNKPDKIENINVSDKKSDTKAKSSDTTMKPIEDTTPITDYSVIPLELISTTENILISIMESTTDADLTVVPLSTTHKVPKMEIQQTVTLASTPSAESSTETFDITTEYEDDITTVENENTTSKRDVTTQIKEVITETTITAPTTTEAVVKTVSLATMLQNSTLKADIGSQNDSTTTETIEITTNITNTTRIDEFLNTNSSKQVDSIHKVDFGSSESQEDVPIFTELDTEDLPDVPEDYYDSKDVVPTTPPKTDAISVIFGLAGSMVESVVESVAERVVPKGIFDLFKRMQKQNEALEAERLRSREENGGLGQFTRGILKSISSGLSKPLSQLMAGAKDIGSLDTDRGFVSGVASGVASGVTSVASVATSVVDAFKDRVQAIYPGTVWCGDGHSATARSSDLGLFFFTDTCCRQHDACKIYIRAGETKFGLTNTGLFTRSHCSCDQKFRECLRRTNSLVSAQIGLTYFNVLGPQCFRKSHPIVRCTRRTRITGQKCEEYEVDYTKPKMWQWFDNETF